MTARRRRTAPVATVQGRPPQQPRTPCPALLPEGYQPNTTDAVQLLAWCISMTAALVKRHEEAGQCAPGTYEGLKALQLQYDVAARKASKQIGPGLFADTLCEPPEFPKLGE